MWKVRKKAFKEEEEDDDYDDFSSGSHNYRIYIAISHVP